MTLPAGNDAPARDNPDTIAALKTHIAYVSQIQDARMEGIIAYIDGISNGDGSYDLRGIREDYLITASSVPVMETADDIDEARLELQRQSRLFSEEAKAELLFYNGNLTIMRERTAARIQKMEDSITRLSEALWLGKDTARLTVFTQHSLQRETALRGLSEQGVDVSKAEKISEQIAACRSELEAALAGKSLPALKTANAGLKTLNREFRATVKEYRNVLSIEMKRSAILAMG